MRTLEHNSVAKLVMVTGNVVSDAEVSDILSSYQYIEDGMTALRFNSENDDDAAFEISADLEVIDIFGNSKDHLNNINYILQKLGWIDCELYSESSEIEHMLLGRLVNINIQRNEICDGAFTSDRRSHDDLVVDAVPTASQSDQEKRDSAELLPVSESKSSDAEIMGTLNEQFVHIQELTLDLSREKEERSDRTPLS
ncbi:hypothetical protein ACFQAT_29055 [Undibacterium arcticum]|uniref:hypothetical protein n=1 Tax=Undibacterium arcticum TaxID=1762892 RepID=UPI003606E390